MQKWRQPVEIVIQSAGRQTVHGPFAAAMMLTILWPTDSGKWRAAAERDCLRAAEGGMDPEKARTTFIAAAREAGVTVLGEDAAPDRAAIDLTISPSPATIMTGDGQVAAAHMV